MAHYAALAFSCILLVMSVPAQIRGPRKIDPQAQLMQYYKQYPDRYIRVSKESWKYTSVSRMAVHSFTLNNTATVPYCEVEMKFSYQDDDGKTLATMTQVIPGILQPYRPVELKGIRVKPISAKAANMILSVSKALICR